MSNVLDILHDTIDHVDNVKREMPEQEYRNITSNLKKIYDINASLPRQVSSKYSSPEWLTKLLQIRYLGGVMVLLLSMFQFCIWIMILLGSIVTLLVPRAHRVMNIIIHRVLILQLIMLDAIQCDNYEIYWLRCAIENLLK